MDFKKSIAKLSSKISYFSGDPIIVFIAICLIIVWMISGPIFNFSDTWQLIINTVTNIIALIMVFVIQNTQNRDGEAVQIKLDELILAQRGAHKTILDIEEMTQSQLHELKEKYEKLAAESREKSKE